MLLAHVSTKEYSPPACRLVLVQTPLRPATHFIGYPHPPQPPLLSAACARLAKTVSPSLLSGHLAGPRDALTAFLPHLPGLQISASLHSSLVCTANLRTLPARTAEPPSATEYGDPVVRYHIRKGRPEDAPALLPLVQELLTPTPAGPPPPERILADMRAATQRGLLYVVSTAGVGSADARDGKGEETATPELAGYLLLGSATPLVVWIRNVLIHAAHRRRGLAERLVGAVTRACLGVSETVLGDSRRGVSVSVDVGVPGCGVKSSVCLRFSDPGAGRVYGRCGFVVDEAATDPGTGEKLCYPYDLRSVTQP